MKKVFLTVSLLITCMIITKAQTEKGTYLLGGDAGFNTTTTGSGATSTTAYNISPNFGYFFAGNIAIGARIEFEGSSASAYTDYSAANFARFYFLPVGTGAKIFSEVSFGLANSSAPNSKTSSILGIQAGPAIFLSKNTALELTAKFQSVYQENVSTTEFGFKVGFQIHFRK